MLIAAAFLALQTVNWMHHPDFEAARLAFEACANGAIDAAAAGEAEEQAVARAMYACSREAAAVRAVMIRLDGEHWGGVAMEAFADIQRGDLTRRLQARRAGLPPPL